MSLSSPSYITALVIVMLVTIHATGNVCFAQATEYHDRESWEVAVGEYSTIGFDEVPTWTWVSDEYEHLGVLFDGFVQAQCCDFITYPGDGSGLSGFSGIELLFSEAMMWIAADFPGYVQIDLYWDDALFYSSVGLGEGGIGNFGGLASDIPFNRAIITDPVGDLVFIDDLHFGPSIPTPAVVPLLAGLLLHHRRRPT